MNPRLIALGQARHARVTLIIAVMAAPLIVYGAAKAMGTTSNDPRQWLPRTLAETDVYDWFEAHFGTDEIAVVSWPGCDLDEPRVEALARVLEQSPHFDHALTGRRLIDDLTAPPLGLSRSAAHRRLHGLLIEPRGTTTCLVLSTSKAGRDDRTAAVRKIERQAFDVCGLDASELRLAGPTVDAAAIDAESRRLLFQLAGISAAISFIIASLRLRSLRLAVIILVLAAYSTALALALVYYSGGQMNLLMTMLPPLIYVLTISSAVHLTNYYRDAMRAGASARSAPQTAIAQGLLPCSLAAVTTAVGLASLVTSKIDPIRFFGIYAASGVIAGLVILLLLLPAALHVFPPRERALHTTQPDDRARRPSIIGTITRHHGLITVCGLILLVVCGARIPFLRSTVKLQDRFLPSSDALADYRWLEESIGPMVPLEVVIHIDNDDARGRLEQIRLVAEAQARIQSLDQPVATMSAVNLCGPLPKSRSVRSIVERRVLGSERTRQRLIDANLLRETGDQQLWRIMVRAPAVGNLDYGYFVESIRESLSPWLDSQGVHGTFTGVIPLIYKAQRQLLEDLFRSFLVAFGVIAAVLLVVLRSVVATLLAMIPNIFPAVVVFGSIEWADVAVQIGSVMTASAALGIAVDDTVHVLTWFRRGLAAGMSRRRSIRYAFGHCAGAMVHTTLICASGLLVFTLSSFVPILHFAWLMVLLLLAALVGDLVLLPAILSGPLGRTFERSNHAPRALSAATR